jgi:hypothetical protein
LIEKLPILFVQESDGRLALLDPLSKGRKQQEMKLAKRIAGVPPGRHHAPKHFRRLSDCGSPKRVRAFMRPKQRQLPVDLPRLTEFCDFAPETLHLIRRLRCDAAVFIRDLVNCDDHFTLFLYHVQSLRLFNRTKAKGPARGRAFLLDRSSNYRSCASN